MCGNTYIKRSYWDSERQKTILYYFVFFFLYSQKYTNGLVCQILIKHSSVDRCIGWGYFCAKINNAAIKMDVQVSLR